MSSDHEPATTATATTTSDTAEPQESQERQESQELPESQESPWALQLAVRVEKQDPPSVTAACAVAALATIELLDDDRSGPGGIWHAAVSTWNAARIRKIVRRARASAWDRAQTVAGVTVERDGAEVRAFVPSPMDEAPREITRLQIQSTPLEEPVTLDALPELPAGALVVAITPHFTMSWGKQAAQSAHAAQREWMRGGDATRAAWDAAGRPIVVLHPDADVWKALDDVATTRIHDGGFTEIPPGTNSSVSWFAER